MNYTQGSEFIHWLAGVLRKLNEDIKSSINLNSRSKSNKKFTKTFGSFKLYSLIFLGQTSFNISNKSLSSALVKCIVLNKADLDKSNQLALGNSGA